MLTRRSLLQRAAGIIAGTFMARTPIAGTFYKHEYKLEREPSKKCVWNGAFNRDWYDPRNWKYGMRPQPYDDVWILAGCDIPKDVMITSLYLDLPADDAMNNSVSMISSVNASMINMKCDSMEIYNTPINISLPSPGQSAV